MVLRFCERTPRETGEPNLRRNPLTAGRLVADPITRAEVARIAEERALDWVKAVVDVSRGVVVIGGDMHADDEAMLLGDGSRQRDLWGINLYPARSGTDWIEFDSLINIRPRDDNRSRSVEDPAKRQRIRRIVESLVVPG